MNTQTNQISWIAADWGTSNLRVWAMNSQGPVAENSSADGMGKLAKADFEPALIALIEPWLGSHTMPVVACGMVGSRQGWHEAPYRRTPCRPIEPKSLTFVPTSDSRIEMMITPGLMQTTPADVMRGEETQIGGAMSLMPGFDGVLCLPGTHSKWAHISADEVVSFQTYLTGELFELLSQHSVLRHGMVATGWVESAFDQGFWDAYSKPEKIATRLFSLRAEGLISGLGPEAARSRLSGLLIGIELAAAKPYWLGQDVVLVGAKKLGEIYARALGLLGVTARSLDATACTLAGLGIAQVPFGKAAK
jgi:2-dehydro-3-deoxygalactonokinase